MSIENIAIAVCLAVFVWALFLWLMQRLQLEADKKAALYSAKFGQITMLGTAGRCGTCGGSLVCCSECGGTMIAQRWDGDTLIELFCMDCLHSWSHKDEHQH